MSPMPTGFISYFESRFPKLLLHCVMVACSHLAQDKHFSPFCGALSPIFVKPTQDEEQHTASSQTSGPGIPIYTQSDRVVTAATQGMGDGDADTSVIIDMKSSYPVSAVPLDTDGGAVIVWYGSVLADKLGTLGWWRDHASWASGVKFGLPLSKSGKPRGAHLVRSATDFKYRSRLCTHWELSGGSTCPMRKKGKCDFAHGPLELRVKETRRDRWGRFQPTSESLDPATLLRLSGGEDVLGAARSIEKVRHAEGSVSEFERSTHISSDAGHVFRAPDLVVPSPFASKRK
jgi:Ribonuclease 2-5A